jgi:hypothetical protein
MKKPKSSSRHQVAAKDLRSHYLLLESFKLRYAEDFSPEDSWPEDSSPDVSTPENSSPENFSLKKNSSSEDSLSVVSLPRRTLHGIILRRN